MLAPWRIEMFGRLRVSCDGYETQRFQTRKAASLLAFLAVHLDRPFSRDSLADMLWPELERADGRRNLRQALHSLRNQLDSALPEDASLFVADQASIRMEANLLTTDLHEFLQAARPRLEATETQLKKLLEAVELYREPFLPGLEDAWVENERIRVSDVYTASLARVVSLGEAANELDIALDAAKLLLNQDPLQEESHLLLIRLHALRGERTLALRHSETLAELLASELGELPSTATLSLVSSIESGELTRDSHLFPAVESWPAVLTPQVEPAPLPDSSDRFFGRQAELVEAYALLDAGVRLVTLFGFGGSGKTRLALEIGRERSKRQSVAFVSLEGLVSVDQLPSALAEALRLKLPPQAAPLAAFLVLTGEWREGLLILDNFENLGEAALPFIENVLAQFPGIQILVTSTHRLGLPGEKGLDIGPLRPPAAGDSPDSLKRNPSVQLYLDRTAPKGGISPTELTAVAELCVRLDGIPLAIELAAAWVTGGGPMAAPNRPSRHRSLQSAIEYGFGLLPAEVQVAFESYAIFQGSWNLEAAQAIHTTGEAKPLLSQLEARSFIKRTEVEEPTEVRFSMLDTLRNFGLGKHSPEKRNQLRQAHRHAFLQLALEGEVGLQGPEQANWLKRLERDLPNLLAALESAFEAKDAVLGLKLATALTPFWEAKGPLRTGREWLEKMLSLPLEGVPAEVRADALDRLGWLTWNQGDFSMAMNSHAESLAFRRTLNDRQGIARALYNLGITSYRMGDLETTQTRMKESLEIATEIGDDAGRARALLNLGNLANDRGEYSQAKMALEQSYQLEQSLGNWVRAAAALNNLGVLAARRSQWVLAGHYYEECLKRSRELGHVFQIGFSLLNLGQVSRQRGKLGQALEQLSRSAEILRQLGQRLAIRDCLLAFAQCAATIDAYKEAALLLGASTQLNQQMKAQFSPPLQAISEAVYADCTGALGKEEFERVLNAGAAMSQDEALDAALFWARNLLTGVSI